jgi:ABC-type hemin transport system substrate-binding protein
VSSNLRVNLRIKWRWRWWWCWCFLLGMASLDLGVVGTLDAAPKTEPVTEPVVRIISLSPHITEWLYHWQLQTIIVAVDGWSDYPPNTQHLPKLGLSGDSGGEALLRYRPTAVLVWADGVSPAQQRWFARMQIPLVLLRSDTLAHWRDDLLALLANEQVWQGQYAAQRKAQQQQLQQQFARLAQRIQDRRQTLQAVRWVVWHQPVLMLGGATGYASAALQACGWQIDPVHLPATGLLPNREWWLQQTSPILYTGQMTEHMMQPDGINSMPTMKPRSTIWRVAENIVSRPSPRFLSWIEQGCVVEF